MGSSLIFTAVLAVIVSFFITGTQSVRFTFNNNCGEKIWPGALTNANSPQLGSTGFELAAHSTFSLNAPQGWGGRFWARMYCSTNNGRFTCSVGDCGSGQVSCNGNGGATPVSLAEFTLNGDGGKDFYDISLVDGSNIRLSIDPDRDGCPTTSCLGNINADCPDAQAIRGGNGAKIACNSACSAFHRDEDCCAGAHNKPETCHPSGSSMYFKRKCPQAYSYAYDDRTSTFTCPSGGGYHITFCP